MAVDHRVRQGDGLRLPCPLCHGFAYPRLAAWLPTAGGGSVFGFLGEPGVPGISYGCPTMRGELRSALGGGFQFRPTAVVPFRRKRLGAGCRTARRVIGDPPLIPWGKPGPQCSSSSRARDDGSGALLNQHLAVGHSEDPLLPPSAMVAPQPGVPSFLRSLAYIKDPTAADTSN